MQQFSLWEELDLNPGWMSSCGVGGEGSSVAGECRTGPKRMRIGPEARRCRGNLQ